MLERQPTGDRQVPRGRLRASKSNQEFLCALGHRQVAGSPGTCELACLRIVGQVDAATRDCAPDPGLDLERRAYAPEAWNGHHMLTTRRVRPAVHRDDRSWPRYGPRMPCRSASPWEGTNGPVVRRLATGAVSTPPIGGPAEGSWRRRTPEESLPFQSGVPWRENALSAWCDPLGPQAGRRPLCVRQAAHN